jgi:eukaryotic-like serine/threonine-protein kinase
MSELASGVNVGSYSLLDLIGRTSMSEVWRAQDADGRIVALKTISAEAGGDPNLQARFLREGDQHRQLKHPAIVPIFDFFEDDGGLYLVMQYLSGGSLEDRLERGEWKPLPVLEALQIARQILPALDYAHRNLVIHRDVKPSNILLDGDRAFLSDFGIALALGRPRLTIYPQIMGTRCYMSPEQIRTPLEVTHLTDVYSFGCVFYEMLTGRQPYTQNGTSEEAQYAMLAKRVREPPVSPRQWNPEISPRLERILLTSLASEEKDRFPGCGSFLRALEGIENEGRSGAHAAERGAPLVRAVPAATPPPVVIPGPSVAAALTPAPTVSRLPAPAANAPGRVSVQGNMLASFGVGMSWLLFAGQGSDLAGTVAFLCFLASNLLLLRSLYKAWKVVSLAGTRITPGAAVGLLFIPLYNLYWCWEVLPGLAAAFNRYVQQKSLPEKPVGKGFYRFFCIFHFYLVLYIAPFLPTLIGRSMPIWLARLDFMLLIPIMIGTLADLTNRLAALWKREAAMPKRTNQQVAG